MTHASKKAVTRLLGASSFALLLGVTPAFAVDQAVIDRIVDDLAAQGFTSRIEIDIERDGLDVEAYGPGREGDFYFTRSGRLVSSDIDDDNDSAASGNVFERVSYSDDDDEYDENYDDEEGWSRSDDDEDEDDRWSGSDDDDDDYDDEDDDDDDDDDYEDDYEDD